jgi:acetyl esterase/lipase
VPAADAPTALLDIYRPQARGTSPLPMIMLVHGGGFISSTKDSVADYAVLLAAHGYVVGCLDYTLAPRAHYPVPVKQANAGLRYLVANAERYGGDLTRVFIGGDSAGAQIASQTAALETNPTLAASMRIVPALPASSLRGALLFCGFYNMRTFADSGSWIVRTFMWAYLGRRDWPNTPNLSQLSTTEQVTNAYPPTLLTVGDADALESQGHELVAALQRAGVSVRSQFYSGARLGHEYQFNFNYPQTNQFFQTTLRFLAERSGQLDGTSRPTPGSR